MISSSMKRPLVLVVDDDPIVRLLARRTLEPDGFTLAEADDGTTAIDFFTKQLPDILLLDVKLPTVDGFTTCERLRSLAGGDHIPVLMITGHDDVASINRAYEVGATDFISKPINWLILKQRLRYMLRASQVLEELWESQARLVNSLHEKDILLKEVHHRVKNNIQIISSLLNLQSRYIKDREAQEIIRDSRNRIESMALIHEKLYRSKDLEKIDMESYISELTSYLFNSYSKNRGQIDCKIHIGAVELGIDTAIPLSLMINELVVNSLKHAFPDAGAGEIVIELQRIDNRKLKLIFADNGGGFPPTINFPHAQSLGLQLIQSLAEQLIGNIELKTNSQGTTFNIILSEI
jgi:two-component sensor histidine kinase/CheY-like chemotaxis protein